MATKYTPHLALAVAVALSLSASPARAVELYAAVQDRQGRPVAGGLDRDAFIVLEDGVPRPGRRRSVFCAACWGRRTRRR